MPTHANPYAYTSPIGQALARLGQTLASGPSQAQRIKAAEEALQLKRQREGITQVSDLFGQFGSEGFDRNAVMSAAISGGLDPSDIGGFERYGAANLYGATDPRTTNAQVGAGSPFSATAKAFGIDQANTMARHSATLAENARQFDQKPIGAIFDGRPAFVPQADAFGDSVAPILSMAEQRGMLLNDNFDNLSTLDPAQQSALGAQQPTRTPRNYVGTDGANYITYDGLTDARTGEPLPEGRLASVQGSVDDVGITTATQTGLEKHQIAIDRFKGTLDLTRRLAEADPTNFGLTGIIKGAVQDASVLAENLAVGMGYTGLEEALDDIRKDINENDELQNKSIFSGIFDPGLPSLKTASNMLIYSAASALAGQDGRDLSDADVEHITKSVGDPSGIFTSQKQYLAKLDTLEELLRVNQDVIDRRLGGGTTPAPTSAPAETPRISTEEEYNALPPGARYIDPNGVERTKRGQ